MNKKHPDHKSSAHPQTEHDDHTPPKNAWWISLAVLGVVMGIIGAYVEIFLFGAYAEEHWTHLWFKCVAVTFPLAMGIGVSCALLALAKWRAATSFYVGFVLLILLGGAGLLGYLGDEMINSHRGVFAYGIATIASIVLILPMFYWAYRWSSSKATTVRINTPAVPLAQNAINEELAIWAIGSGNAIYPAGTRLGGILWSKRFSEVRVSLRNDTAQALTDLDFTILPDRPATAMAQTTNVPNVTIISPLENDGGITRELVNLKTGERTQLPLVQIASDAGFRVLCNRLERNQRLEFVLATVSMRPFPPNGTGGGITDRDYVLRASGKDKRGEDRNAWYGYGHDEKGVIEEPFLEFNPPAKTVKTSGRYTKDGQEKNVSKKIEVVDVIGNVIPEAINAIGSGRPPHPPQTRPATGS